MATAAGGSGDEVWPLPSGTWRAGSEPGAGFSLVTTALGHEPGAGLPVPDLRAMFLAGAQGPLYPPEFGFSPASGQALQRPEAGAPWVAPFGAPPRGQRPAGYIRGLQQCSRPLALIGLRPGREQEEADATMPPPPPGHYEFFSLRAATAAPVLLALDPDRGLLYLRLPHGGRWEALAHPEGRALAEAGLQRPDWRCELAEGPRGSRLLLPTQAGLLSLKPDAPALGFGLQLLGDERPALGSPIQLGERVWLPMWHGKGKSIRFLGVDAQGGLSTVDFEAAASLELGRVHAPVSTGQRAIWRCAHGQLQLRRRSETVLEAGFQPWPAQLRPAFDFGCPYLSRDGNLWQLCLDESRKRYVYLRLGDGPPECQDTDVPRSCSGTITFRSTVRDQEPPWVVPEHVDDARGSEAVLPLLESEDGDTAIGLRLQAPEGLAGVFDEQASQRCELVLDDRQGGGQHAFAVMTLVKPWRTRLFVHDGLLWAYHPALRRIPGWRLAS